MSWRHAVAGCVHRKVRYILPSAALYQRRGAKANLLQRKVVALGLGFYGGNRPPGWLGVLACRTSRAPRFAQAALLAGLCAGLPEWLGAQQTPELADQEVPETTARIESYQRAIAAEPSRPELHFQLGLELWSLGDASRARTALNEELRLNPANYRCQVVLGMIRVQQRDYRGAIQDLESALTADASLKQAYYPLGQAWFHLEDFQKAREYLEKAVQVESPAPALYAMLFRVYSNLGQQQDAVRMSKLHVSARCLGQARAAAHLGLWTEADRLVSDFLNAFPSAADGLYLKAVIAFDGFRRLNQAITLLEQVLAIGQNNLKARRLLAVLQWAGGNREAFEKDMKLVLAADPLDGQAHYYMGRYDFEKGILASAREHLETAQRLRASDYRVATDLARVYQALGLVREAEQQHRAALALIRKWPSRDPVVYANYAEFLLSQGRPEPAMALLEEILRVPDPQPRALYLAGIAYASTGKLTQAEEYLKRTAAATPGDPRVHLALAKVYDRAGRKADAAAERLLAAKAEPAPSGSDVKP